MMTRAIPAATGLRVSPSLTSPLFSLSSPPSFSSGLSASSSKRLAWDLSWK